MFLVYVLSQQEAPPGPAAWDLLILCALVFFIFWLLVFRPQKKQEQERRKMLDNLKKGDRVTTTGGIIGKVINVKDDKVTVKVDENSNTKLTFVRSSIAIVNPEEKKKK